MANNDDVAGIHTPAKETFTRGKVERSRQDRVSWGVEPNSEDGLQDGADEEMIREVEDHLQRMTAAVRI